MPKMANDRRKLTEDERAHVSRLLWGRTNALLAKHVNLAEGVIRHAMSNTTPTGLPIDVIARLMATQPDDIPKPVKRVATRFLRVFPKRPSQ